MLEIIVEESLKAIREYWEAVSLVLCFGVASVIVMVLDEDRDAIGGIGIMLLIAFIATTIVAVGFLGVRVFRRIRE